MKWYESRLAGAIGGAAVVTGTVFFAVFASTDDVRALVSASGGAFFGHLAAVYGLARVKKPA